MLNLLTEHERLYEVLSLALGVMMGLLVWAYRERLGDIVGLRVLYVSYVFLVFSMLFTVLEDLELFGSYMEVWNFFEHLAVTLSVLLLLFWCIRVLRSEDAVL
jgi:hypothetical protein